MDFKDEKISSDLWKEKVYIETTEHIIIGYIYMPKICKKNRILSDVLNSSRQFIAVKVCTMEYKHYPERNVEEYDFIQVNLSSILIMRPIDE